MTNEELTQRARAVLPYRELSDECSAGGVSAALLTAAGNVYVGVCIDASCCIGSCAEHAGGIARTLADHRRQRCATRD